MLIFKINDKISLKLENKKTNIYVNNKLFLNCKAILINISGMEFSNLHDLNSIDEAVEKLEKKRLNIKIPSHIEFWAHCSNIQAWAELNYDSDILNYRLAFPLLRELTAEGDLIAKKRFKEEIVKKFEIGYIPIIHFFIIENYLRYFNKDEKIVLWDLIYKALSTSLNDICNRDDLSQENITFLTLSELFDHKDQKKKAKSLLKSSFKKLFEKGYRKSIQTLIDDDYLYYYFNSSELLSLLFKSESPFTRKIIKYFKENPHLKRVFEEYLRECEQYDQKRMEKTGEPSNSARDCIIELISVVINPNVDRLYSEFKDMRDLISKPIYIKMEDFAPTLSEESVVDVLANEWLTHEEICSRLNINDTLDARFVRIKLNILKRKDIVSFKTIGNDIFWKLNNS